MKGVHVLTSSEATAETTGTATELPNCLYAWVSETGILNLLSYPISLAHSRGVSLRGLEFGISTRISDPSL